MHLFSDRRISSRSRNFGERGRGVGVKGKGNLCQKPSFYSNLLQDWEVQGPVGTINLYLNKKTLVVVEGFAGSTSNQN